MVVGFEKSLLHEGDVSFELGKVFGEMGDFVLEGPLIGFRVAELKFEGVNGSGLFSFDIEKNMNFHFHLIFLSFYIFEKGLYFFVVKLLLCEFFIEE